jgi:hypothetical protein
MTTVVGVHGIWQGRTDGDRLSRAWTQALTQSLQVKDSSTAALDVRVAWLTPLLNAPNLTLGSDEDALADLRRADDDELAFVSAALADALDDLDATEVAAFVQAGQTLAGLPAFLSPLARFLAAVDGRWRQSGAMMVRLIHEVYAYLYRPEIGFQVRRRVVTSAPKSATVAVAHSLGSVIAYDLLRRGELPEITHLVTMGSPLAWPTIQRGLADSWAQQDHGPRNPLDSIEWTNVHDPQDPVTAHRLLAPSWPNVTDHAVTNPPLDTHGALHYLRQSATAAATLRGLSGSSA